MDVPLHKIIKQAVIIASCEEPDFECFEIVSFYDRQYASWQQSIAKFIAEYYTCSLGEALSLMSPFSLHVKAYEPFTCKEKIILSSQQQEAKNFLQNHSQSLLFGDTGSGKTEIYMSIMEEVLARGKSALLLMPEIGLTPQMKKRLEKHFGDVVALWHSKLTKKKKEEILSSLAKGHIRIIAGARSALFLPLPDIGLIVVDEEHDESYKASNRPRYNARDMALVFGQKLQVPVVLGSATPSLTSYTRLPTFRLKGTFYESSRDIVYEKAHNTLSPMVLDTIAHTMDIKKQAIVFLPTRAHFKYVTCKECGISVECPYCSVGMSLHKQISALKCHYCHYTQAIPKSCHSCGSEMMEANRMGTSEMVEQLREAFPLHVIEKFDRDEVTTETKLKSLLKRFNEKEIDILVGTQMLSKGHDYHDVALSVIMGLDSQLMMPDFKAREKALALCLQIAGRSGRKGVGRVLIQTMNPEFFDAYMGDFEKFLNDELPYRKGLYPPFTKMLRLLIAHKNEVKCQEVTHACLEKLERLNNGIEIIGSGRADIGRIAGKHRYHVLLRSVSAKALLQAGLTCKAPFVEIDMDPQVFS